MKKSKILTISLIVLLVALGVGAVLIFGNNIGFTYANADQYTAGGTTVNGVVDSLDVNWLNGQVKVEYHSGSGIIISETGNRTIEGDDEMRWWLDGSTLRIQYSKSGRIRLFDNLKKTLIISLPEGTVLKTAKMHMTSGDVEIPELTADETDLTLTSGDIDVTLNTKKLTANATSGDLTIRLNGETEDVKIGVTSGNLNVDLGNAKRAAIKATSGDMVITGKPGDVEIGATSGKINVNFGAFENLKIGVTSGNVKAALPEDPGFTCEVSMTSGDFDYNGFASVSKDGKIYTVGDGSRNCTIKTTSGDILLVKAD